MEEMIVFTYLKKYISIVKHYFQNKISEIKREKKIISSSSGFSFAIRNQIYFASPPSPPDPD